MDSKDASEEKIVGILPHINSKKRHLWQMLNGRSPQLPSDGYARLALDCYEKEAEAKNVKFEVKKTLGACRTLLRFPEYDEVGVGDWCHVSFIAKPSEGYEGSEFFFFAELGDFSSGKLSLMNFFKSGPDCSGMALDCGFCSSMPGYPHPSKFVGGLEKVSQDADYQQELLQCFELQLKERKRGSTPPLLNHETAEYALSLAEHKKLIPESELVQPYANYCWVGSYNSRRMKYVNWVHLSFIAKPKNGDESSEKLMFAELVDYGERQYCLRSFEVLDPNDSEITQGCRLCPSNGDYPHPRLYKYSLGRGELDPFEDRAPWKTVQPENDTFYS